MEAVKGVDLHVDRGEVFALLGPNERSAGDASVLGHDPWKNEAALKRRIGIVLQSTGVDPFLTVRETVDLCAGYYDHPRDIDEVIDLVGPDVLALQEVGPASG